MASEDARLPPARPPESCAMYQMDDIDDAFLSGKKNEIWYIKVLDNKQKNLLIFYYITFPKQHQVILLCTNKKKHEID